MNEGDKLEKEAPVEQGLGKRVVELERQVAELQQIVNKLFEER